MRLRISPCLWFDARGEEAARLYVSVFPNSKVMAVTHYSDDGRAARAAHPDRLICRDLTSRY